MANCRIQNLTPECGYNAPGVDTVLLLDFEDFKGFVFENGASYASCYVESILHTGAFIALDLSAFPGQFSSSLNAGIYAHGLEGFIAELSGPILSDLHLASKRPQLVVFRTRAGRYFTFGHDNGARVSYALQTAENAGAVLSLTASSHYPLFEVSPDAFEIDAFPAMFVPLFDDTAVCEIDPVTDIFTGFQQASIAVKVSIFTGEPLDRDGRPTAQTGLPQAALTLESFPAPAGFEVVGYYERRALLNGEPTVNYAPDICAEEVPAVWILDTGLWNNAGYWLDNGIWNY